MCVFVFVFVCVCVCVCVCACVCLCLGVHWCACTRKRKHGECINSACVYVLRVSLRMHGGRSHTERCSPVSAIRGLHKHGVRGGERERQRARKREGDG